MEVNTYQIKLAPMAIEISQDVSQIGQVGTCSHFSQITTVSENIDDVTEPYMSEMLDDDSKQIIHAVIEEIPSKDPQRLSEGCTTLMYACQQGNTDVIIMELRSEVNAEVLQSLNEFWVK